MTNVSQKPTCGTQHPGGDAFNIEETFFDKHGEDLYVYRTNPTNPRQYWYRGRWEAMRTIRDTIAVKGEGPVIVDLRFTRHGPVVHEDSM